MRVFKKLFNNVLDSNTNHFIKNEVEINEYWYPNYQPEVTELRKNNKNDFTFYYVVLFITIIYLMFSNW